MRFVKPLGIGRIPRFALDVDGGIGRKTLEITGSYTIKDSDPDLLYATAGGTVDMPTVADNEGRVIVVARLHSGGSNVTLDGEGAETIDGVATLVLSAQYQTAQLLAVNGEWVSI